jgi:hypothetical protein
MTVGLNWHAPLYPESASCDTLRVEAGMGLARDMMKKVRSRVQKYGEKVVSVMADTSADAPNRFSAPKRDLYEKLESEGKLSDTKDGH